MSLRLAQLATIICIVASLVLGVQASLQNLKGGSISR
jgi:hypothetical protein